MKDINIVLLEPQIPQNTGNIARTCAATGASLHLIRPMGFEVDDKKLKRAGLDYWHQLDITYYENFDEFLEKNEGAELFYFSSKGKHCYSSLQYPDNTFLVFGCETRGLPEKLIEENIERSLRIPMLKTLRCLNLSNAVAVAVYEFFRQDNFSDFEKIGRLAR